MKKFMIPILILSFALVSACNNTEKESDSEEASSLMTVKGQISNAENQTLLFQKLTPSKLVSIDSIQLDAEGNFHFSYGNTVTDFYRLVMDNSSIFLIADENETIEIKASGPHIGRDYTIKGSPESLLAKEMNAQLVISADSLQALNRYYQSENAKPGVNTQALFTEVNEMANGLFESNKTYLNNLIKEHNESLFIYLALYQTLGNNPIFGFPADEDLFDYVLAQLQEHHPESAFTQSLKSDLNKMRMQAEQEQSTQQGGIGIDDIAPNITMENPEGEVKSLHDLRGQYVLLDFWAAWCRPCRMENPNILADYNKYKSENFTIFQVSLDKTHEDWVKGIQDDNLSQWTHVSDLKYWNSEAAQMYGVQSIPASFLLDPDGKIIAKNLRGPALGAKLEEIFGH
ncbi:MAG: TlpA disulfide reductase family protein [Bacteroidales bacterium]|jgi:peroxiredoxin|nr:TlpA disulfide reductase family protein [Bacteroidales bacterium]